MTIEKRRVSDIRSLKRKASWVVGAASALFCSATFAQDLALEEIIVTATKRAESTQTIPLSITAISGDTLEHKVQSSSLTTQQKFRTCLLVRPPMAY